MSSHLDRRSAELVLAEIDRCSQDFEYFCKNWWEIDNRDGGRCKLDLSPEQRTVNKVVFEDGRLLVVKARKLGISTDICALGTWMAKFHGKKIALVVHEPGALAEVYHTKIRRPLGSLPPAFDILGHRIVQNKLDEGIRFENGGSIRIGTPNSEPWRGGDIDLCHFSEFASYDKPERVMNSALDAMFSGGKAIIETTAMGLGLTHQLWYDSDTPWSKVFFSWKLHPLYTVAGTEWTEVEDAVSSLKNTENKRSFDGYVKGRELSAGQAMWAFLKLGEKSWDWLGFHREFPATPELAFSVAQGRVFQVSFPVGKPSRGWLFHPDGEHDRPKSKERYVLGVDCASGGDDGDHTAMSLGCGNAKRPELCATGYFKIDTNQAAEEAVVVARKYGAMIMGERNTYGLAFLQRCVELEYPYIWREVISDRGGMRVGDKLGYSTNVNTRPGLIAKMKQHLGGAQPNVWPWCPRLQREVNDFRYNPDKGNKEMAADGGHDDLLFAFALMCLGLEPEFLSQHKGEFRSRPRTVDEISLWEIRNHQIFDPGVEYDDDTTQERENAAAYRALGTVRRDKNDRWTFDPNKDFGLIDLGG